MPKFGTFRENNAAGRADFPSEIGLGHGYSGTPDKRWAAKYRGFARGCEKGVASRNRREPPLECPKCNAANLACRKFCRKYGAALERRGPSCRALLEPGDNFCKNCGSTIAPGADSAGEQYPSSTGPSSHSDERPQAIVLLSDLSGYTAMNKRLDPEEPPGTVGRIKTEAVRIVERRGGLVY